ncbi:hypothetical protein EON82_21590 [bacterium]|nr:MAG: hypothetical protein EON82_21590 [bacterium]
MYCVKETGFWPVLDTVVMALYRAVVACKTVLDQGVTIECRAKINTFLAVGPPDKRGWHPLRTIFQEIDLADTITIEPAEVDEVAFSVQGVPAENTVTKALRLIREHEEVPPLRIHVEKRIPMESGLGGGSSDAAGLIRHLFAGRSEDLKWHTARAIGADVPFFLYGGRAKGTDYGDFISPLPPLPKRWLVLARPAEGCPTPEMFRKLEEKPREFRDFPTEDELYNDFERVAPCGSLELIERLRVYGADDAALTGSGSVVFGRFPDRDTAEDALAKISCEADWCCLSST